MKQIQAQSEPVYGFHTTPFGECCIAFSNDGICAMSFPENRESAVEDLYNRFREVDFKRDDSLAAQLLTQIFSSSGGLKINPIGTDFQLAIWKALQTIPKGQTATYAEIAEAIGKPKAVRAVGTAIGANPIAFLIPCHRVIRSDGTLGGYRWGLDCKIKILAWEKEHNY